MDMSLDRVGLKPECAHAVADCACYLVCVKEVLFSECALGEDSGHI